MAPKVIEENKNEALHKEISKKRTRKVMAYKTGEV